MTNQTATVTTPVEAAPKAPSKKSLALAIFTQEIAKRTAGQFDTNKAFRASVLARIVAELAVTMASASTMYNAAKKDAETADATVALGRDPKKVKVASATGKRGRPVGSKNKAKEVAPALDVTALEPAAEVAPTAPVAHEEALM